MTNETKKKHFRCLENMYHTAPCNNYYKPKMTISEGKTEVNIQVKNIFFHAAGAVHGAVYFKLMDDAAYFAVNSLVQDTFVLTSSFNIYLIRPISSGIMRAVGKVVSISKNQFLAEATVYDFNEREISRGSGLYVRSKIPLSEDIGYKLN